MSVADLTELSMWAFCWTRPWGVWSWSCMLWLPHGRRLLAVSACCSQSTTQCHPSLNWLLISLFVTIWYKTKLWCTLSKWLCAHARVCICVRAHMHIHPHKSTHIYTHTKVRQYQKSPLITESCQSCHKMELYTFQLHCSNFPTALL